MANQRLNLNLSVSFSEKSGFAEHAHRCCQLQAGSPGCVYANYHVSDYMDYKNLNGFVKTIECDDGHVPSRKDVYALDCEMCYTTAGLELTRVTVVDINRKTVYDALVKPTNKIVDYNTTYVTQFIIFFFELLSNVLLPFGQRTGTRASQKKHFKM